MRYSFFFVLVAFALAACQPATKYQRDTGFAFGTQYNIVYEHPTSLRDSILARFAAYDSSMSKYNKESLLSQINRGETDLVDSDFVRIYRKAEEVNLLSEGAFDITVAPLSRIWHFDENTPDTISLAHFDSLALLAQQVKDFVGLEKTHLDGLRIVKDDERVVFDANALAEGYGIDLAAEVLEKNGVVNYMVELGGELHIRGLNPKGQKWRIGIEKPIEGSIAVRENQHIVEVTDCAISTSGSYRQYYYRADGVRLSHTIDPRTGTPSTNGMVSATIIGPNTMTTDALSTACMVMGRDKARELIERLDGIELYMIYLDSDGKECDYMTPGFEALVVK